MANIDNIHIKNYWLIPIPIPRFLNHGFVVSGIIFSIISADIGTDMADIANIEDCY